jgi:hypothetical protein
MTDSSGGCYVILHVGNAPSPGTKNPSPLVVGDGSTRFELNADTWIEKLGQLAPKIQRACEPRHHNYDPGKRHLDNLYAFVRRVPTDGSSLEEAQKQLLGTVALSRLIHPTRTGDRYFARVLDIGRGDSQIEAILTKGVSPDVYIDSKYPDWLSVADAEKLSKLMPWLSGGKRKHPKVWRAIWNHEYAMRSGYLDMQWILVVSGLEALFNTKDKKDKDHKWQFCERVRQRAQELGVALTDSDLSSAYDLRSKIAHGDGFLSSWETILPEMEHRGLYQKLESVLRSTVRKCLLDESFGDLFRDDDAVKNRWQCRPKPKKGGGIRANPDCSLAS